MTYDSRKITNRFKTPKNNFVCTGPIMLKFEPCAELIMTHTALYFQPNWCTVGAIILIQIFDGRMARYPSTQGQTQQPNPQEKLYRRVMSSHIRSDYACALQRNRYTMEPHLRVGNNGNNFRFVRSPDEIKLNNQPRPNPKIFWRSVD